MLSGESSQTSYVFSPSTLLVVNVISGLPCSPVKTRFPLSPNVQDEIHTAIRASTYTPRLPPLPQTLWEQTRYSRDPDVLGCLECLGDARIAYLVAIEQTRVFPDATLKELTAAHAPLLTNSTFQHLAHKLGVDGEAVDVYSKGAGDAIEVFVEMLGKTRPLAAAHWTGDVFRTVISAVMGEGKPRSPPRQTRASTGNRARVKKDTPSGSRNPRPRDRQSTRAKKPVPTVPTPVVQPKSKRARKRERKAASAPSTAPIAPSTNFPSAAFTFTSSV
ncbi:hypothetical protein DFH06DRAFT_1347247 [Mycena polygramma]|nr:hypothetical protein DFH06DRAFT_1347247 [Mycena polygramma]